MEPSKDIDRRDTLQLGDKKFVTKLLKSGGNFGLLEIKQIEKLIWTGELTKINKRKRSQVRRFILTTRRFINLGDDKFMDNLMSLFGSKIKRAVDLEQITAITYSEYSNEFVLHIPSEYDYRLRASEQ